MSPLDFTLFQHNNIVGLAPLGIGMPRGGRVQAQPDIWQGPITPEVPDLTNLRRVMREQAQVYTDIFLDEIWADGWVFAAPSYAFDYVNDQVVLSNYGAIAEVMHDEAPGVRIWFADKPIAGQHAIRNYTDPALWQRYIARQADLALRSQVDIIDGTITESKLHRALRTSGGGVAMEHYHRPDSAPGANEQQQAQAAGYVADMNIRLANCAALSLLAIVRMRAPDEARTPVPAKVAKVLLSKYPRVAIWEDEQPMDGTEPMLAVLRDKWPLRKPYRPPTRTGTM